MIKTAGLTKKYGDMYAIQNIDLDLDEGDLFGFIGPMVLEKRRRCASSQRS
ncbi:MAG: hypothetical protein ACJZ8O_12850 [Pirellulaceae bacterium]